MPVGDIEANKGPFGHVVMLGLAGSGVLMSTGSRLYRFDPPGRATKLEGAETGIVVEMHSLPGGDVLIAAEKGVFRFAPLTGRVLRVDGAETGGVGAMRGVLGGDVLLAAEQGWFVFEQSTGRTLPIRGPAAQDKFDLLDLTGGGVLIGTEHGPVRFDPSTRQVLPIEGVETGRVHAMHSLSGGDVLIAADRGWFRFDLSGRQVLPVGGNAMTGAQIRVGDTTRIKGGSPGWFSMSGLGTFVLNSSTGRVRRVSGLETDIYLSFHSLLEGGTLIGTIRGVALVPGRPLTDAKFDPETNLRELVPRPEAVEVRARFEHPCAPVADKLGLALIAAVTARTGNRQRYGLRMRRQRKSL